MAEDEAGEVIGEDLDLLRGQWTSILQEAGDAVAPALLHQDLSVVQRLMRDVYSPETDELIVDCPEQADEALAFCANAARRIAADHRIRRRTASV